MPTFNAISARLKLSSLYGITHRSSFPQLTPFEYLNLVFQTGAPIVQWREKDLDPDASRPYVQHGAQLALLTGRLFLVNSYSELALQAKAHGVHLPSSVDSRRGPSQIDRNSVLIWGRSVHSFEEAVAAEAEGADYVLLGPIFPPLSKEATRPPLGIDTLARVAERVRIPVFALGGMEEQHLDQVLQTGAAGLAGISWLSNRVARRLEEHGRAGAIQ